MFTTTSALSGVHSFKIFYILILCIITSVILNTNDDALLERNIWSTLKPLLPLFVIEDEVPYIG